MPSIEVELPRSPSSPTSARQHLASFLAEHGRPHLVPDATLIVSELVANAVMHGREPIRLAADMTALLRVNVFDGDPRTEPVAMRAINMSVPGGRGLRIVNTLADRWGVTPRADGKVVWADLAAPAIAHTAPGQAGDA
jgi:anti-sigma regulatory factor (Ser/Thr protein kinase)